MSAETPPAQKSIWNYLVWVGYVLSTLPILGLAMSAYFKLAQHPQAVEGMKKFGYPENILFPLGVVEVACTILYAIPKTSVLGAILLTGYLGGAIATHVRMSEGFEPPVIMGVMLWLGLYFRDARIRALVPFKS